MTAPFPLDSAAQGLSAVIYAFTAGAAFGFFLERGGLGNAKKISGQFYLSDFTVFRVMFTAIVTAMIGLFWFSRLGLIDLSAINFSPTYLLPQLTAGILFGAGLVTGGLCPGTSCVAAASGSLDGLSLLAGILCGIFLFAETFSHFYGFLYSTGMGRVTLEGLLGVSRGIAVLAVTVIALAAFIGIAKLERESSRMEVGE